MDETGIKNVHKPPKIVATKGARQVSKITSGERDFTVTVICAMNAVGTYLPPMLIFPRKRMADVLMVGAPPEAIEFASSRGWTDSTLFLRWLLEHFAKFTNASVDFQQIIVLDGHHCHKTLAAVEFARTHGIHLITLPPHSTHKMQPLDRTYFKSLKSAYNAAADSWMVANPGKRITACDVAGIFCKAYLRSASPEKDIKGFDCCGIWLFNEHVFTAEDFTAGEVAEQSVNVQENEDKRPGNVDTLEITENISSETAAQSSAPTEAEIQQHPREPTSASQSKEYATENSSGRFMGA